jgi:RND family efflux transporter MFP subunit
MTATSSQLRASALDSPTATVPARRHHSRRRFAGAVAVAVIAIGLLVVMLAWRGRSDIGAGLAAGGGDLLTYTVEPIDLRVTVLESGTLESASSVKVFSEVEGQVAIISLRPEGTRVSAGDVVVELDTSSLAARLREQQIVVEKARAGHGQAQQQIRMAESQRDSDVSSAELALEFARLDLKQYVEGDYPQEERVIRADITLAEEELKRAEETVKISEQLHAEGYLSDGEFEADRLAVTKNRVRLELTRTKLQTLQKYTFVRRHRDLESKVQEAERGLARTREMAQSAVDQKKSEVASLDATLRLEEGKLAHIEAQLEKCTMRAPQSGVVVYPIPTDNDLVELFIKQGTIVRERQHVFSIPDTNVMQVSTSIHEAMVNQVKPGMSARIWVDVYHDLELNGTVTHVSPLPDPEDWRRTTVKFYETKVSIADQVEGLRPGMSTKVEILLDAVQDTLAVPVQSVIERQGAGVCYVRDGSSVELRTLQLGRTNYEFIEVRSGLSAGERIVLAPDVIGVPENVLQEIERPREVTSREVEAVASAPAEAPAADKHEIQYSAILRGDGGLLAEAQYEIKTKNGVTHREFDIEVRGGAPEGLLEVEVNGVVIGEVALDAAGNIEMEWSEKDSTFPANFPEGVGAGSTVRIGAELAGTLEKG